MIERRAVSRIAAEKTVAIRWPVLRDGLARETAIFPGDDLPSTVHLGLFVGDAPGELAGVASLYPAELIGFPELSPAWQLRGMAIIPGRQQQGLGGSLLTGCLENIREANHHQPAVLWCNARVTAAGFYSRHGLTILGDQFEIPTAGPHYRMWRWS